MDKFKKAIEQLNKPIRESNKTVEIAPKREPKKEVAAEPEVEPVQEQVTEPVVETEPEVEPVQEQVTEPVVEVEPVVETEPVVEPVIEAEPAVEPVVEVEPVAEQETETTETVVSETESAAEEMSDFEKELEAEFLSAHPESKALLKHKKKEAKKKNKEQIKEKKKQDKQNKIRAKKEQAVEPKGVEPKEVKAAQGGLLAKYGIRTIVIAALIILVIIGCFANIHLNNQLKPVFYQVQSNKVVENVRVVAISDMHLKEFGDDNIRLVEKIKSYHPDIIAILGDMNIDDNPDYSKVINLCARLNNVAPLYYALGNHEFDAMLFKDSQIYYDMKAAGIKVLNNEVETIEVGLSTIDVIGITQGPKRFREDAQKFFEDAMDATDNFKLVLTHYPENFDGVMEEYPIDLALCGHAHGGQVRLPLIGGLYSSDQGILPKLCDGYHEIENSKVIITKGLGRSGVVPRINNPPEITIVDINWY